MAGLATMDNAGGYRALTAEQLDAVQAYADWGGRCWKAKLNEDWQRARLWGSWGEGRAASDHLAILQGLRNSHGPSWLVKFRLPVS